VGVFVTGTMNSHFCNETDRHDEFREKNVNQCPLLNLKKNSEKFPFRG